MKRTNVLVQKLPQSFTGKTAINFLKEAKSLLGAVRPRLVLDLSGVRALDNFGIHVLFQFAEEAFKRNGDVKLSGIPFRFANTLRAAEIDRIFEIFDTASEAAESYQTEDLVPAIPTYWDSPYLSASGD